MAFTKITEADREGKGNVGQPDTPLLTTTEMQEQMDSLPNLAIDAFNRLIDELSAITGSASIGCDVPDGYTADDTIQSVLDAIALEAQQSVSARHTHANKATLDAFSADTLTSLNSLISMFALITAVETSFSGGLDKIPTSSAIATHLTNYDWKTTIKNAIYPIGSVYTTTSIEPDAVFGTTGAWTRIKIEDGISFYKRIS